MKLLEERPLTLAETAELLAERKKEAKGGELGFEQENTLAYAEKFAETTAKKAKEMQEELEKIAGMTPQLASKIADLCPKKIEEVIAIVGTAINEEGVKEAVKIAKKYAK